MKRNTIIFAATFLAGAFLALLVRAALFDPHAAHADPADAVSHAPLVTNPPESATRPAGHADHSAPQQEHAVHATESSPSAPAPSADNKPVNSICAICGMPVDPKVPTAVYQGKTIGFGCRMCPPKFKAEPDRYGPYYLRNETVGD